jgi:pantoate--beta-alanine ligase
VVERRRAETDPDDVALRLDYIEMNDSRDLTVVPSETTKESVGNTPMILSGALFVDTTRLIDNLILGDAGDIVR